MIKKDAFIHSYAKGFFIVKFDIAEDKDLIIHLGLWFWGNSCLCMKPWTPFNPLTYILSLSLVWVRHPNLPLHFWGLLSLRAIGSALGKPHFASPKTKRHNMSTCSDTCGNGFL